MDVLLCANGPNRAKKFQLESDKVSAGDMRYWEVLRRQLRRSCRLRVIFYVACQSQLSV